jgi:hypothetical protein
VRAADGLEHLTVPFKAENLSFRTITKRRRKKNFALSGGIDVAQALVPAGSRLFSTPCLQARRAPR